MPLSDSAVGVGGNSGGDHLRLRGALLVSRSHCWSKVAPRTAVTARRALDDADAAVTLRPLWDRAHYRRCMTLCAIAAPVGMPVVAGSATAAGGGALAAAAVSGRGSGSAGGQPTVAVGKLLRAAYVAVTTAQRLNPGQASSASASCQYAGRKAELARQLAALDIRLPNVTGVRSQQRDGVLTWVARCSVLSCKAKLVGYVEGGAEETIAPEAVVVESAAQALSWANKCTERGNGATGWYVKHPLQGGGSGCFFAAQKADVVAHVERVLADSTVPTTNSVAVVQRAIGLQEQALLPK